MPVAETPEQREKRLAKLRVSGKLWRERNPDYFKNYYKDVMCEPVERARLLAKRKEWQAKNRDYERIRGQRRRAKNPEANRAYQKAWARAHQEQARAYYAKNRPAKLLNAKQWAEAHPEHVKRYHKEYHLKNAARLRASASAHQKAHRKESNERVRRFNQLHPEKRKEWGMRRRATMRQAVVVQPKQIRAWLKALRQKPAVVCYYCRETIPSKKLHVDHVIAVSRGGEHSPANLAASCSDCNMAKGARPIQQWQRTGQQILSL